MTQDINMHDIALFAPEILLAILGMFLLIGATLKGKDMAQKINMATGVSLAVAATEVVYLANMTNGTALPPLFGGHVAVGAFAFYSKFLILIAALAALVLGHASLKKPDARAEYPILILLATIGMMLMVSANSLLGLYMGLELQSLSLYVLAAIKRDDAKSSEAGLKYFVLGALASGLLLYGISYVYGSVGSIMFGDIQTALSEGKPAMGAVLGFVMILSAFAFKISAAPFHMWTPDVYQGAPTPVTAFFAAAPKLAAFALLIKILMGPFAGLAQAAQQILVILCLVTMAWGAFAAIAQTNIKRLMAYSSIGHVGFALLGLIAGGQAGGMAALTYLTIYLPMTLGAFAIILSLKREGEALENLSDFAGFSRTRPVLAALMALIMFSMIGIPPLAGFFGKLYVFMAAVQAGYVWLAVAGVILSVVGAFYYLRIIKIMYFDAPEGRFDRPTGWGICTVMGLCVAFLLGFIISPETVTHFVQDAVQSLVAA